MKTMLDLLESASEKPIHEWSYEEMLAYEIQRTDSEILKLQRALRQAQDKSARLKQQMYCTLTRINSCQ